MKEASEHFSRKVEESVRTQRRPTLEWLARIVLNRYWKIGELSPQGQKYFFHDFCPAISLGEKLSLAEAAKNLLDQFDQEIVGQENIPKAGPVVVVGNHWKGGPMRGMWGHFLASEKVKEIRGVDVKWIIQDSLERPRLGKKKSLKEMPGTKYFFDKIANTFDLTEVTAPFKIDRAEAEQKARVDFKLPISTFRTLKRGGIAGFYPEAAASDQLVPAWPGSSLLLEKIAKKFPSAQIQPVGILNQERKLILNFGQPFTIGEVFQTEVSPGDYLMAKIALLLPQSLSGYYSCSNHY